MATTSTVPTVKAQLVSLFGAALDVPVTYAWPGPETESKCVFLGPHPQTADIRLDRSSEIPTIKAGRQQRQESYTVRVTVWSFRPDLTTDEARDCEQDAFDILAVIDGLLAADPRLGLGAGVVQMAEITDTPSTLFPFNSGWACELAIDIAVRARLT